ncbi:MAG: hypothetical protein WD872_20510 [Pirellulaceae bacterium]
MSRTHAAYLLILFCVPLLGCDSERAAPESESAVGIVTRPVVLTQNAPVAAESDGTKSLAYPTGNRETSVLLIAADPPREIAVGKQFEYHLKLTNLTEHLALENLEIFHASAEGIELVGAKQGGDAAKPAKPAAQTKKSAAANGASQPQTDAEKKFESWTIKRLPPGETATIKITAVGDKAGMLGTCLGVRYDPVLCLVTKFVKPEVELTKAAPESVGLCDQIVFRYTLKNSGSGAAKDLVLTDPLPEGFKTVEGADEAKFEIAALAPGASQEFDVRVVPSQAGEFSSRAAVRSSGGIEVLSSRPVTKVVDADLAIEAHGPEMQVSDEPFIYRIKVTNRGEAVAEDAVVVGELSPDFRPLSASDPYEAADAQLLWRLGNLKPGASKSMWIRLVSSKPASVTHTFRAGSECARQRDLELAQAVLTTEIVSFPALAFVVADRQDPVEVGQSAHYNISVVNEGKAPAKNIEVVIELPAELKYVKTDGIQAQAEGNRVTFQKVDVLEPGGVLQWSVEAKVEKAGVVKFQAELTSDSVKQPAIAMEPTRFYSTQAGQNAVRPESGEKR